jgi:hypothetical protein
VAYDKSNRLSDWDMNSLSFIHTGCATLSTKSSKHDGTFLYNLDKYRYLELGIDPIWRGFASFLDLFQLVSNCILNTRSLDSTRCAAVIAGTAHYSTDLIQSGVDVFWNRRFYC